MSEQSPIIIVEPLCPFCTGGEPQAKWSTVIWLRPLEHGPMQFKTVCAACLGSHKYSTAMARILSGDFDPNYEPWTFDPGYPEQNFDPIPPD